jgi:Fe-S-cluster-containing hydrogenase component 2
MIYCDIHTCVGCRMCEVACSSFHSGAVSPALARIRVAKPEEIGVDLAVACVSCREKPCLDCPMESLSLGESGEILLATETCNACESCVLSCPIGAVGFFEGRPLFCDLCGGRTVCVSVCPTQALSYREEYREIPLAAYLGAGGNSGSRRLKFALKQGETLRMEWRQGRRIDS